MYASETIQNCKNPTGHIDTLSQTLAKRKASANTRAFLDVQGHFPSNVVERIEAVLVLKDFLIKILARQFNYILPQEIICTTSFFCGVCSAAFYRG